MGQSRKLLRLYGLIFLAWTVAGLFFSTQDLTRKFLFRDPTPAWHYLVSWLVGVYCYALLTPAVLALGRRFPLERRRWVRNTVFHLVSSVVFAFIQLTLNSAILARLPILPTVKPHTFITFFFFLFILGFNGNVLSYWLVLGLQHGLRTYRRYQEREQEALRLTLHATELKAQLSAAELGALKAQLHPHFLFNTLNAIMVLVRQAKLEEAETMLDRLSDLLRSVLDDAATQEVPLRRELQSLELYLSIEQVRFQDRLRVEIAADPEVLDAAVPHLALQPLVENAVRHGIGQRSAAGRIEVRARRTGESLTLTVQDDGPGLPTPEVAPGRGIGLANTRARLRQLYGEQASLTVGNAPGGGAVARMVLPFREAAPGVSRAKAVELCT